MLRVLCGVLLPLFEILSEEELVVHLFEVRHLRTGFVFPAQCGRIVTG